MSILASPRVGDLESVRKRCARRLQRQLQSPELRAEKASSSVALGSRSPTRALSPDIIPDVSPEALAAASSAETRLRQPGSVPPARGSSSLRSPRGRTHEEAESRPRLSRSSRSMEDLTESCSEGRLPRSRSAPRILCSPAKEEIAAHISSENGERSVEELPVKKEILLGGSNGVVSIRSLSAARHEARAERSLGGQDKGIASEENLAPALSPRGRGSIPGDSSNCNAKAASRDSRHSYGSYTAAPSRTSRGSYCPVTPLSPIASRRPVALSPSQGQVVQRSMRGSAAVPSGTNGSAAPGSASVSNGPVIHGFPSSSAVTAKSLSATVPSSAGRPTAFATPRSGLGGSMRSAVPPRTRETQAGSVRGAHVSVGSQAVPSQRNRSPSCSFRATSTPLQGDVPNSRSRGGRMEPLRSYVPPQRSPRNSGSSAMHRKSIARAEHPSQAVPVQMTPVRAVRAVSPGATLVGSSGAPTSTHQSARVEQMSAVAQSLQAAALALQRVAAVSPGAPRTRGLRVRDLGSGVIRDTNDAREAAAASLAGAAQRVRADWLPPASTNSGMLSVLSRENAALREALNDTTRKLNELEDERQRLASDVGSECVTAHVPVQLDTVLHANDNGASNGHEAASLAEVAMAASRVASVSV